MTLGDMPDINIEERDRYYCTKCNRHHISGSKIFEDHFEFMGEHL